MLKGTMRSAFSSRGASTRIGRTGIASASTVRYLDDIERECADIRSNVVIRVREQSVETLLKQKDYEAATERFQKLKQMCRFPKKKKKMTKSDRRRAVEMQTSLAQQASEQHHHQLQSERRPFSTATFLDLLKSTQPSTTPSTPPAPKLFRRRHSFILNCAPKSDLYSPVPYTRSARSFIGETNRSVEAL